MKIQKDKFSIISSISEEPIKKDKEGERIRERRRKV